MECQPLPDCYIYTNTAGSVVTWIPSTVSPSQSSMASIMLSLVSVQYCGKESVIQMCGNVRTQRTRYSLAISCPHLCRSRHCCFRSSQLWLCQYKLNFLLLLSYQDATGLLHCSYDLAFLYRCMVNWQYSGTPHNGHLV